MRRLPRTWHSCSWGNYGDDANCSEWAERIWVQTSSLCLFFQQHSAGAHKTLNNISMRLLFSGIKALYLASEQESVQRVFVCGTRVCVYMCVQGTIKNVPLLFFFLTPQGLCLKLTAAMCVAFQTHSQRQQERGAADVKIRYDVVCGRSCCVRF